MQRQETSENRPEHILVCLSSAPSNAKIIRTAARMAEAFRCSFTALFVQTPDHAAMAEPDKARLQSNIRLAEQLGATIETVYGDDVSYQIAEYARLSGVSRIVIGRSTATRRHLLGKPTLTEKLIAIAPNLDIHIIPDAASDLGYHRKKPKKRLDFRVLLRDNAISLGILVLATLVGFLFSHLGLTEANIITIYLLGVLIAAVMTTSHVSNVLSAIVSVLVFNFFFTAPQLSLKAYDRSYPVTFLVMLLASLIAGSLASRLKQHARQSAQAAYRTNLLFETNQLLQKALSDADIFDAAAGQLSKLLGRSLALCPAADGKPEQPRFFRNAGEPFQWEPQVALWVLEHNRRAGASTDTFPDAQNMYYAIRVNDRVHGVVGIEASDGPLDAFENSVMLSILGECALALESSRNAREKEEAKLLAQNEQLRANLLRSISHDLRTPLTTISGNASNLLSNSRSFDPETRQRIYRDIYDDAMWLINLVENLLSVTRIEEGRMELRMTTELMDEVIAEALRHINRRDHSIELTDSGEFLLARMDARLISQVIVNLVDNAVKYTPAGCHITVSSGRQGDQVAVTVADDGPGIPAGEEGKIFDMFYTGNNRLGDSRRSLGLGLALCKTIIGAHGGRIFVENRPTGGAAFTFTLPAGEVEIHE